MKLAIWMAASLSLCMAACARAELQLSIAAGHSQTKSSSLHVKSGNSDFVVDGVRWREHSFQMPPYYEWRITYFSRKDSAVGFFTGITHMKVYAQTGDETHIHGTIDGEPVDTTEPMDSEVSKFNISHGVNFIALGVQGRLRLMRNAAFPNGRLQPYVGAAFGPVVNHPENKVFGEPNHARYESKGDWGSQAMIGARYGVSHEWAVYTEAKVTHVNDKVGTADGTGQTTLNSTHILLGVVYGF